MYIYNYIYVHSILEDIISYLLTLATLTHLRLGSRNFPVPCFSSAKKKSACVPKSKIGGRIYTAWADGAVFDSRIAG